MKVERTPQCILGHGDCPPECRLYQQSAAITNKLGDNFDPGKSRAAILFADAFNCKVNVARVEAILASCAKECQNRKE